MIEDLTRTNECQPLLRARVVPPEIEGCAFLEVNRVAGESAVTKLCATAPLKLLAPRSRGPSVWAYTSNFGGGLVAGDQTRLDLRVGPGARCFLSTQASSKIYRNPDRLPCRHVVHSHVGSGAVLVYAPDPVQCFAEASYEQTQEFYLESGAGLVLIDWLSSGRAARGERWAFAHYSSRNAVFLHDATGLASGPPEPAAAGRARHSVRAAAVFHQTRRARSGAPYLDVRGDKKAPLESIRDTGFTGAVSTNRSALPDPLLLDSLRLDPDEGALDSPSRMGRFDCVAMLAIIGEPFRAGAESVRAHVSRLPVKRVASLIMSASPLRAGTIVRVAGPSAEAVAHALLPHLSFLHTWLGDDPWARKW